MRGQQKDALGGEGPAHAAGSRVGALGRSGCRAEVGTHTVAHSFSHTRTLTHTHTCSRIHVVTQPQTHTPNPGVETALDLGGSKFCKYLSTENKSAGEPRNRPTQAGPADFGPGTAASQWTEDGLQHMKSR